MTEHHDRDHDPTPAVWSLFILLERSAGQGDGPDDEENTYLATVATELGISGLMEGWSTVAALLRRRLQEHAERVGCDCGSDEWLSREQYRLAQADIR